MDKKKKVKYETGKHIVCLCMKNKRAKIVSLMWGK